MTGCKRNNPSADSDAAGGHEGAQVVARPSLASSSLPQNPNVPFSDVTEEVGLVFVHETGATGEYYFPEIMGSGVGLIDYDRDGDLDIYAVQGSSLVGDGPFPTPRTDAPTDRLFRNDLHRDGSGSEWKFVDVTEQAGLGDRRFGMGCAVGDYDIDGDADLYVTNVGSSVLYRNNGDVTFTEVTTVAGVDNAAWGSSAAFLDYDGDGFLDLFAVNYVDFSARENKRCYTPSGARDYCSPQSYQPVADKLFRNRGDGTFEDVSTASGIDRVLGSGLGVACTDFNGDDRIDIFVANDGEANALWINQGDGTFADRALLAGVAFGGSGEPQGSMGVAVGDYDGDGDSDIFITNLKGETNALYRNQGSGVFDDATFISGLGLGSRIYTGFGTEWLDYDNDGRLDLFITNGAVTALEWLADDPYPYHQVNRLFRNRGDGAFEERTASAGPCFARSEVGRGAAFGDLDNDGDVDIVVANNRGPMRLLRNNADDGPGWVTLDLEGATCNRDAYGAEVAIEAAGLGRLVRHVHTDGSYLAASDPRVHFGLGETSVDTVSVNVQWPDGRKERWDGIPIRRQTHLRQGTGTADSNR